MERAKLKARTKPNSGKHYAHTPEGRKESYNMQKKKATGTKTAAGSRSTKRSLDTGVEVDNNEVKKNHYFVIFMSGIIKKSSF